MQNNYIEDFYDTDGKNIQYQFDITNPVGEGYCGKIYRLGEDKIIKIYNPDCDISARLAYSVSKITNEFNNPHVPLIDKVLYKEKPIYPIDDDTPIEAYIRDFIKDENICLLLKNKEYVLENIKSICNLFDICSKHHILIDDLKRENIVFGKDKIIFIDPDTWFYCDYEEEELIKINRTKLLALIKTLFFLEILEFNVENAYMAVNNLLNLSCKNLHNIDIAHTISKKLCKCKYPIDYILKNR